MYLQDVVTVVVSNFISISPIERISDDILLKAISEGSGNLKPAVVIMHGPPGAGKSSVKDLILGRPPRKPEEQNSTGK